MLLLRSLAFNLFFYVWTVLLLLVLAPALILPGDRFILNIAVLWGRGNLWALRVICGMTYEMRGLEHLPPGAKIVAAKHQSAWETFALLTICPRPAYILKRELTFLPLFGWALLKTGQIAVHRGKKGQALASISEGVRRAAGEQRHIMIFPEGTRRAVDAPPDYKYGVVHIYRSLDLPVTPIALNAGLFWPRRSILRRPGKVLVEVLPPIPPGLAPEDFANRLESDIETATARLVAESRAALAAGGS